jgi:hypothetical protein
MPNYARCCKIAEVCSLDVGLIFQTNAERMLDYYQSGLIKGFHLGGIKNEAEKLLIILALCNFFLLFREMLDQYCGFTAQVMPAGRIITSPVCLW